MTEGIPNCYYRISIKALMLDETRTRFLVVQEDNGKWEFPGGGLNWGETPKDGLTREIMEEMGLLVTSVAERPSYFTTGQTERGTQFSNVFFETTVADYNFTPSDECVALKFVTKEEALTLHAFSGVHLLAQLFDPTHHQ